MIMMIGCESDAYVASRNLSTAAEQLEGANVSPNFYRVIFKPTAIIPIIDLEIN